MADLKRTVKIAGDVLTAAAAVAGANGGIDIRLKTGEHKIANLLKKNKLKTFGRYSVTDGRMSAFWSACGFEMNIECKSDSILKLTAVTNDIVYLAVFVDGEQETRTNAITAEMPDVYVALKGGKHTLRVLRDTQINTDGSKYFYFDKITFDGKVLPRPTDREKYIEIIGDSIACGDGALGTYQEGVSWNAPEDHSAVAGFAYKTAMGLDADYSVVARGGIGLYANSTGSQEETDKTRVTMQEIYDYTNGYADMSEDKNRWKFKRKPDLIIFELSGNDSTSDEELWREKVVEFLKHVRKLNGKDVPIVWSGRNPVHYETLLSIIESGDIDNFYACRFSYGGSGSAALKTQKAGHPSAAEQTEICDNLLNFIEEKQILKEKEQPEVIVTANKKSHGIKIKKSTDKNSNTAKKAGAVLGAAAITGAAAAAYFIFKKNRKK